MKVKKDQFELAARLHYGFLPRSFSNGIINAAVELRPYRQIGGDYCSIFQARGSRVIFSMCDVVGHSIASALVAARVNTFIMAHAMEAEHPCDLIEPLNSFLCRNVSGDLLFTSIFSLILDLENHELDARNFCTHVFREEVHSDRYHIQDDILLMTICSAPVAVPQ